MNNSTIKIPIKHIILLLLLEIEKNTIERDRLKRLLYIFSIIINEDYLYRSHPFGPESGVVNESICLVFGADWVKIIKNENNVYYTLTTKGKRFALTLYHDYRKNNKIIEDFVNKTKNIDTNELTIVSKILFYLNNVKEKITIEGIKKVMTGSILTHKKYENDIIEIFKIFELLENNKNEQK